jgi:hypothetical protein
MNGLIHGLGGGSGHTTVGLVHNFAFVRNTSGQASLTYMFLVRSFRERRYSSSYWCEYPINTIMPGQYDIWYLWLSTSKNGPKYVRELV